MRYITFFITRSRFKKSPIVIPRICIFIALLTVIFPSVLISDPIFKPPVDYSVIHPICICGADFDGDLDNDLAILNGDSSSNISIFINNGNGTFQTAINYPVGGVPVDMVAANFIGNSHIDLAVLIQSPDVVLILAGNGDGTFQDTVHVGSAPAGSFAICTGDFENDGDNDLAAAGYAGAIGPTVRYYIYNLSGVDSSFYAANIYHPDPWMPYDIVSADFDGDNMDDLAVLDILSSTYIWIYRSGGMWSWFSTYTTQLGTPSSSLIQIFCANVNGGTNEDIIGVEGIINGGYVIFLGNGNCFFGPESYTDSVGNWLNHLYVADFDNDSDTDIVLGGFQDSIYIVLNDGIGSFSSPDTFNAGGYCNFIYGVELNGDYYNDLVVTHKDSNTISVLMNGLSTYVKDNNSALLTETFQLSNNYPNPFNPTTTIEFDLPKTTEVTLKVYNILGEEVTTLVSDRLSAGSYSYDWDATNLASGVYLYRLQAEDYVETRKMVLMR